MNITADKKRGIGQRVHRRHLVRGGGGGEKTQIKVPNREKKSPTHREITSCPKKPIMWVMYMLQITGWRNSL